MLLADETHLGPRRLEVRVGEDRGHLVSVGIDHVLAEERDERVERIRRLPDLHGVDRASGRIGGRDESLRERRRFRLVTAARDERDGHHEHGESDGIAQAQSLPAQRALLEVRGEPYSGLVEPVKTSQERSKASSDPRFAFAEAMAPFSGETPRDTLRR
jgi:hypothetical protein